jgi:phosphoesterase RecJ-like protein
MRMNCTSQDLQHVWNQYGSIMLTAHVSPDGDAIGSLLTLYHWLKTQGKHVVIVIDDDIDDKFNFLEDVNAIQKPAAVQTDDTWLSVVSMRPPLTGAARLQHL